MKKLAGLAAVIVLVSLALGRSLSPSPAHSTASTGAGARPSPAATATPAAGGNAIQAEPLPAASELDLLTKVVYRRTSYFVWPAIGPLTSYFGPGHPLGIDIGLDPSVDTPVRAAAAGTVTFAGGSPCCSYGYYVEIAHDNGLSTLYGHFSKLQVSEGDIVEQGQVLGIGGSTGDADGRHVHFEVRDEEGALVDPLRFLPPSQSTGTVGAAACPDEPLKADAGSLLQVEFRAVVPEGFEVTEAAVESLGGGYGDVGVNVEGPTSVWVDIPFAPAATGQTYRFALNATFAAGDDTRVISCELDVKALQTFANSPSTIAAYRAKFLTATATPTVTRTPRRTATPRATSTKRPSVTPSPNPHATKTATPASKAVTPTKPASR